MSNKPLSVSAYNLYMECPAKYDLQKNKRIYPLVQMSYFAFGSAVDAALNALLEKKGNPLEVCNAELERLLKEPTEFLEADYDGELLTEETKKELLTKIQALGSKTENIDALIAYLFSRPFAELSENQRKALALCCHASLREKARLMIEAYTKKVLPLITSVDSVQRELKWKDEHGNEFIGYMDLELNVDGHGALIADNKTSSNPYRDYPIGCVEVSFQLAVYSNVQRTSRAAYFVMDKAIKKNRVKTCGVCGNVSTGRHKTCDNLIIGDMNGTLVRCGGEWTETIQPEVDITIRVGEIPEEQKALAQSALSDVAEAVNKQCYPKNLKSCRVVYGRKEVKCPYFDYCRSGSMAGLKESPKRDKN